MVAAAQTRFRRTGLVRQQEHERRLVRLSHTLNAVAGLGALVLVATVIGLSLYALGHQGRIYQGVSVAGVDVSGMTETEATDAVQRDYSIYMNTPLNLTFEGKTYAISPNELGIRLDAQASVDAAMQYGRDGSLWSRSRAWAEGLLSGSDVPAVLTADNSRVDQGLLALTDVVARPATNAWIDFSSDNATVVPEVPGVGYNYGMTRALVMNRVQMRSSAPIVIATTVVQPDVTAQTLTSTLPSAQTAVSSALLLKGMNGQNWSIDAQQLKSIVSVSSDGTAVTVDRDAVQRLVSGIAESVNRDATDAVLFVNGDGKLEIVPGVNSLAVNVDKTVDDISSSLVAGTHDVNVTIDQKQPAITDERANASLQMITNTLANGLSVKWDGGQKQITPTDLLSALVIKATPDQADAFGFSLSHEVLAGYIKAFAGDIEVEPHEPTFRLVNGEIKAEKKGQTGVVINYDSSAERIEKAIFSGYGSSNLKVDVIKPTFSNKDASAIKLPDVLGEAATPYSNSSEARKTNVERAVDLMNGWLIAPGEEFSYVDHIGQVTEDNGFVVGLGIVADPSNPGAVMTAPVVGGGICQVSTTIFQSAFWSGMTFTERHQHPYWINSYGIGEGGMKGLDAMVNIEDEPTDWAITLDMKFVNTTDHWIAIEMTADGDNVTSRILGTNPGWTIDVSDPEISNITKPDETPIRQDSPEVPSGEERQVETAQDGFDADINRVVKDKNGSVLDSYDVVSSYSATSNRVLVGTGQ
ncbi:MAG TPA: peptidoglycan binding domain-containing protein [Thermomicrobiales bacterium]|nr:peptidoglycan binding domain-containing protein [Thermomicrobiales bacterium]